MDRPERVGLVFPRSGQQLYVHVPSHVAQTMQQGHQDRTVVKEQSSAAPWYGRGDDESRDRWR
jgi:hypothetical protein